MLAAVLRQDLDWSVLQAAPTRLRRLLLRCLDRDPRTRLRDIGEARVEIEKILAGVGDDGAAPQTSRTAAQSAPTSTSTLLWAVAAALGIVAAVMAFGWWRSSRSVEQALRPLVRLDVDLGPDVSLGSVAGANQIISPDATRIVYVSQNRLFTRRLDQPNATELARTQGALAPFFSPDGQWVAFFAGSKLQKISVDGGSAIILCDAPLGRGGSWGEDGNIIAALSGAASLSRIPSAGGPPTPVTDLQNGELTHRWPQILPRGKAVLFTAHTATNGFDRANIEVMSLADQSRKTLVRGGTYSRYLPSGHLVYVNRGTLFAVAVRRGSAGSSRDACSGTRPNQLQRPTGFGTARFLAYWNLDLPQWRSGRRTSHGCVAKRRGESTAVVGEAGRLCGSCRCRRTAGGWP